MTTLSGQNFLKIGMRYYMYINLYKLFHYTLGQYLQAKPLKN